MSIINILLIAIGLAMDCLAVSVCKGMASSQHTKKLTPVLLMATLFGLFQGGMPLIGYYTGTLFADFFHRFAPWIALIILSCLGGKMIHESLENDSCDAHSADFGLPLLLSLAIATSIDALATGVIFIPHPERLWIGVSIVALISFLFALAGYWIGFKLGKKLHINVEMIGGIILITIGIKICIEGLIA